MMEKLQFYVSLLQLANIATEDFNISDLTSSDKDILLHIWNETHEGKDDYSANYDGLLMHLKGISKSQFYKSIKKLMNKGLVIKVGTERSATYRMNIAEKP